MFDLQVIITGLALLCMGQECPNPQDGISVFLVNATETAEACQRPFCRSVAHEGLEVSCDGGSWSCSGSGGLQTRPCRTGSLECSENGFVRCSDGSPVCGSHRLLCDRSFQPCRAWDNEDLAVHRPRLSFPRKYLAELGDGFHVVTVLGADGEEWATFDPAGLCFEIRTSQSTVASATGLSALRTREPNQRVPKPGSTGTLSSEDRHGFDWTSSLTEFSRDVVSLRPELQGLETSPGLPDHLIAARILLTSGELYGTRFHRYADSGYKRWLSCPDRRPEPADASLEKAMPRALPEQVGALTENLTGRVELRECGTSRLILALGPKSSAHERITLGISNLPIHQLSASASDHFKWFYELVRLRQPTTPEDTLSKLPVPVAPEKAPAAPYGSSAVCDPSVAGEGHLCQPSTYP